MELMEFIGQHVTHRETSMFLSDIRKNEKTLHEKICGKSVLVIGGAGSIGSSYIKALLPFKPGELVVVDINENGLAELTRDLRSMPDVVMPEKYITYPMDFASSVFRKMFRARGGFDIVANFSAHKHVRSEKDVYSVEALMRNNVIHAKKLLDLLAEYPPENYFCVSTDKAANPVNIMGASKRIMEDLIFSYSDCFPVKTARFANVAFSNGSLLAGFLERINKLQPLSAPSDVKRYFVSLEESGQICMLSCFLGNNREIFYPKLREEQMLSFDHIAKALLKENGYDIEEYLTDESAIEAAKTLKKGCKKYPVHFEESNTSGEKMYEEFYTNDENTDEERFSALGVITNKSICDVQALNQLLAGLEELFDQEEVTKEEIVQRLETYLPNFHHMETGKSLDSKM